jgi:hypothetical protein
MAVITRSRLPVDFDFGVLPQTFLNEPPGIANLSRWVSVGSLLARGA